MRERSAVRPLRAPDVHDVLGGCRFWSCSSWADLGWPNICMISFYLLSLLAGRTKALTMLCPTGSVPGDPWAPRGPRRPGNRLKIMTGIILVSPPLRSAQPVVFVSLEFGPRAPHSLVELPHAGQGLRGKFWAACGRIPTGSEPTTGPKLSGPNAQTIWNRFLVCSS